MHYEKRETLCAPISLPLPLLLSYHIYKTSFTYSRSGDERERSVFCAVLPFMIPRRLLLCPSFFCLFRRRVTQDPQWDMGRVLLEPVEEKVRTVVEVMRAYEVQISIHHCLLFLLGALFVRWGRGCCLFLCAFSRVVAVTAAVAVPMDVGAGVA